MSWQRIGEKKKEYLRLYREEPDGEATFVDWNNRFDEGEVECWNSRRGRGFMGSAQRQWRVTGISRERFEAFAEKLAQGTEPSSGHL